MIGFIVVFGIISISIFNYILTPAPTLPICQPFEVNEKLVDSTIAYKSKYHKISDFNLTNQNGEKVTQEFYNNKIYVADFFFTTCQSICPIMTKNMLDLQNELKNDIKDLNVDIDTSNLESIEIPSIPLNQDNASPPSPQSNPMKTLSTKENKPEQSKVQEVPLKDNSLETKKKMLLEKRKKLLAVKSQQKKQKQIEQFQTGTPNF